MALPKLDDLEKMYENPKKAKKSKKTKKVEKKKDNTRIPKTKYDDAGNPILVIPDLNDVDLEGEIEKHLGYSKDKAVKPLEEDDLQ